VSGLHPQVILAGRQVNDNMGKYIAEQTAKLLTRQGADFSKIKVGIFGLTFKENCPDLRNTKVIDIIRELKEYGANILVHDPLADKEEALQEYGISLSAIEAFTGLDVIILAVAHDVFRDFSPKKFLNMFNGKFKIIVDVKSILDPLTCADESITLWRL
jgi:UDP-N-acetyl-D-galactosamine dehydrogenase